VTLRVFVSYKRRDLLADKIEAFFRELAASGFEVLRDIDLLEPNNLNFVRTLDDAIVACDIGVVLWTRTALTSNAVAGEATKLAHMNKLITVALEDPLLCVPSHFFAASRTDFSKWSGRPVDPEWLELRALLERLSNVNQGHRALMMRPGAAARTVASQSLSSAEKIVAFLDLPLTVAVPVPGTFTIGDPRSPFTNQHFGPTVAINHSFGIGLTAVTFQDWNFAAESGAPGVVRKVVPLEGPLTPVTGVSFCEVQVYLAWLNFRTSGVAVFRLPSEAEWEYTARHGPIEYFQVEEAKFPQVGTVSRNSIGVYDMPGGIWEWVEDFYHPTLEGLDVTGRPRMAPVHEFRSARGRSWRARDLNKATSVRTGFHEQFKLDDLGFRIVRATA